MVGDKSGSEYALVCIKIYNLTRGCKVDMYASVVWSSKQANLRSPQMETLDALVTLVKLLVVVQHEVRHWH
jgi:hypothetical protein